MNGNAPATPRAAAANGSRLPERLVTGPTPSQRDQSEM
jgi:hypothetical protein